MRFEVKKRDVLSQYKLPAEVRFCKKCTISNQRPRISFDENGVCSACSYAVYKRAMDWKAREQELTELCNKHRRNDGRYDVIVPCSGGKDGGFVAHQLKYKYGMNPLCVTWAPHVPTDIGRKNLDAFINVGGFDHVLATANGKIHRKMTHLSFVHLGDPFQPFIYGQYHFPLRAALQYDVQLIMYGENGEVEYGGDMKNAYRPTRDLEDATKHYFSGLPPEFWVEHGITQQNIASYMSPPMELMKKAGLEVHFFGYYKFWDPQENFYYCVENNGFTPNPERTEGTYSKYASLDDQLDGFHYYLMFVKFGIGRATSDSAHEIRDRKITREEGVALVKKFDGALPSRYYKVFLDYCDLTDEEFEAVIDSWRSEHIWKQRDGKWELRHAVWHD